MKITTKDGTVFEGTQAEYETFLAFAKNEVSEQEAGKNTVKDEIEIEGEKYRKVEREAQAGDVVVFTFDTYKKGNTVSGKPYATKDGRKYTDDDGQSLLIIGWNIACPKPDVYEKVEAEYVPQEGDIVVVISNEYYSRNSVGDVGKVSNVTSSSAKVAVPSKPDSPRSKGNYHELREIRKATSAEVAGYEKQLHKASFSVGDYVKVVKSEFGNEGKILKITDDREGLRTRKASDEVINADFAAESLDGNIYGILAERIVKATEQEVENALEAAKWAKIGRKVDEYKVGDIIEITQDQWGDKVGTVAKVILVNDDTGSLYYESQISITGTYGAKYSAIKMVAPVESTFK